MKRNVMLVSGLLLVASISVAIACGGGDDKKDDGNSTPSVATMTAEAGATSDDGTNGDSSPGPRATKSEEEQATSIAENRTEEQSEEGTEEARDATEDAEEATDDASQDQTREAQQAADKDETETPEAE